MLKFLKGVVAGAGGGGLKELPYNIGEPYSSAWGSWTHYRGTNKDDGTSVSIFSLSGTNSQDGHLAAARNGVKRLRTVRHPNVLSFLHSAEVETVEGATVKPTIYIITEPVMPLSEKIKELGLEGTQRDEYYAWGLHQIAKAISFLNNDCKLVHGNVCLASVVVTPTLDWKLHAFDVLSEFDGNNEVAVGPMLQFEWLVGPQYKPLELVKNEWTTIRKSPPWAIDSWGLGCLIYELFSATKLTKTEELRNTGCVPKSLLPDYQRLLSSMPSRRLNAAKLIENSEYFHNKLVETIQFMEVLNLKDSVEKDSFFRKLPNLSEQLPRQIVLKKLLPMLASSLEFGSAAAPALNPLLKMGSWLPTDEFDSKVLPTIVKLFASNDRGIRVGLLQHIDQYGASLSAQIVDEQVFLHVATGFSDASAFLRELTLKSMLVLAPKLSQRTITGSLLKYLSKLQVDEEPAIRTNTTILLGNIAGYLNEGTRRRVLINAFTVRALRDGFAPARSAGLMALTATSAYYDASEIATRILPNVVILTIDPDSDVRSKAFESIDLFLQIVKQHHEKINMGDAATNTGILSTTGSASLLGWAMSSLTLKGKVSEQAPISSSSAIVTSSGHSTLSSNNSGMRRVVAFQNETKLAGQMLYYLLTTGSGLQTLGEEYCDISQVASSSGLSPTPARRILLVFFQTAVPYLAERLSTKVAARGIMLANQHSDEPHSSLGIGRGGDHGNNSDIPRDLSSFLPSGGLTPTRWSRLSERVKKIWLAVVQQWPLVVPSLREASQLVVRANLMLFYFEGFYYHIAKRAAAIRYVFLGKPLHQRPRYQILGFFLLIQLCIIAGDWLRQNNLTTLANSMRSRSSSNELMTTARGPPVLSEDDKLITEPSIGRGDWLSSSKCFSETGGSSKCPLCLSIRQHPTATPCGHVFCWNCVTEWCNEKPECPLCRSPVLHSDLVCIYHADF